jgi:hypothetical protein
MWCEVYEPLVNDQWPRNPHYCRKYHERPDFSPRNGLHQKSKNVIYGMETYVGLGVQAFY